MESYVVCDGVMCDGEWCVMSLWMQLMGDKLVQVLVMFDEL